MAHSMNRDVAAPRIAHWINGVAVDVADGEASPVHDPSTGRILGHVPHARAHDVERAIAAARAAFPAWAATPAVRRARILFRFKERVEAAADELAHTIAREHGKTIADAHGEIARGVEVIEFACGIPHLLKGEYSASVGSDVDAWNMRTPLGVVVGITPFNFPAMVPLWMIPVAIACGNTFVLKPSERVPSAALRLAGLLHDAGAPPGVLNVVHGDRTTVGALLDDPRVAGVSFVGSTPVAHHVYVTGTSAGKRVQALGGAKNHLVVMPDADLDQVADALLGAAYGSAGERCMAVSVAVVVGEPTADALRDRLIPRLAALRVGAADAAGTEMGPLISHAHLERVRGFIASGVAEGAELAVDGRATRLPDASGGFFIGATLFDRVRPTMRIYREEIFGPVLSLVRVGDLASALELVNSHPYANGAVIYTRSGEAARSFSAAAEAGMIGVNVPIPVPMAFHSFGGWRGSLFGDHHIYGMEGVRFYTRLKCVTQRWPSPHGATAEFTMPVMR
jgi:malonate-semialdehyde dehydrogenase (acetylating)/methylmalonate-semialdehyde dehydrogenase